MNNCVFSQNKVTSGVIYILNDLFSMSSMTIDSNLGGALNIANSQGSLNNVNITNNYAPTFPAGGIYSEWVITTGLSLQVVVNGFGVIITNNTGMGAGGIYLYNDVNDILFTLSNYVLANNFYYGGAYPQYNELYCVDYGIANTICACNSGLDFGRNCSNCFTDVYGPTCSSQCNAKCNANQICNFGLNGSNTCICINGKQTCTSESISPPHSSHTSQHKNSGLSLLSFSSAIYKYEIIVGILITILALQ